MNVTDVWNEEFNEMIKKKVRKKEMKEKKAMVVMKCSNLLNDLLINDTHI